MYSFINITGLAVSLAVSILLLLWVNDELSYDRFNVNATNLYKVTPKFDEKIFGTQHLRPLPCLLKKKCRKWKTPAA